MTPAGLPVTIDLVKFWAALGGAVLAMCGSAQASTVITPESVASYPYQRWIDEARVLTPDASLTVYEGPASPFQCAALACMNPDDDPEMYMSTGALEHRAVARALFLHEIGHLFDARLLDDSERAEFASLLAPSTRRWVAPYGRFDRRPMETFASTWASCALYGPRRYDAFTQNDWATYGGMRIVGARDRYLRACRMIVRFGRDAGARWTVSS